MKIIYVMLKRNIGTIPREEIEKTKKQIKKRMIKLFSP
jgi:hypothetical protein